MGLADYYKYTPGAEWNIRIKGSADPDSEGSAYRTSANNYGFRGDDFVVEKKDHTYRILTLGASSTFGYSNKDDETYPVYLQQKLNDALQKKTCEGIDEFQVYNFGIAHHRSFEIHALLVVEGMRFAPDMITFYEGSNDTREIDLSWLGWQLKGIGEVSLLAKYAGYLWEDRMGSFSSAEAQALSETMQEVFVDNVGKIAAIAEDKGIAFVPILQTMKLGIEATDSDKPMSYEKEADLVRQRLGAGERILLKSLQMYLHAELNVHFREWLSTNQISYIDFIKILEDNDARDQLVSWVHLSASANRLLAESIKERVLETVCAPV